ncbi:hypothetical protein [Priestia megaterium]|uniref:hypothetical protein n=1 Tax=Priestia megaterium TaxID=1404 RepID=UPI003A8586BC
MEYIFGDNRPIANAKVMHQLEFKDKDIAETSGVDNKILYIGPKGDLGTYIKIMRKSGDKLWEKDLEHNTLTFLKRNNFTYVSFI